MKKLTCFLIITLLFVVTDYAIAKADETIPEFDGGYIKTIKNEYIEMKSKAVKTYFSREAGTPFLEKKPYVSDQKGIINIPCEEFKGILIKGQHPFKFFSLHTLVRITVDDTTAYEPGKEFKVRSKSTGADSYYFQPRNELQAGKYVAWIGKTFWLFSVGPIHLPMLKQYPLISQKDPKYYRDKSLLTTYDSVPGSTKKALVPNLACAATIYTILDHGLGNPDAVIDDFYVDPRDHNGSGPGAKRPDYVGADVPIDAATVEKSLKQGQPIILHGYGGPLGEHFVLAVGLQFADDGRRQLVAIDPYPGKNKITPGRNVYINLDAHVIKHPSLPITFTEVRPVLKCEGVYIAYANGIVRDTSTGLEWKVGPDKKMTWNKARSWVQSLNLDGGGWRMPTIDELKTLYKKGAGKRNMTPMLKMTGWWAWSGETKGSSEATFFNFYNGHDTRNWNSRHYSESPRAFAVRSRSDG